MLFNDSPPKSVNAHKPSANNTAQQFLPFCVCEVQDLPLSVIE
jgi:hypothetical protein